VPRETVRATAGGGSAGDGVGSGGGMSSGTAVGYGGGGSGAVGKTGADGPLVG